MRPANFERQDLVSQCTCKSPESLLGSAIPHPEGRPVVIVLFDPTSGGYSRMFQAPMLCRPDSPLFQAAIQPPDIAVAFRAMIRRPAKV